MNLQNDKPLTSPSQRKAGIVSINRFAGIDAVCLYALGDCDRVIEHSEVLKLGEFLNGYIANARASGAESCSELSDGFLIHDDAPIGWVLGNFSRYLQEHKIGSEELTMMIDVAIGARAVLASKVGVGETALERPNV